MKLEEKEQGREMRRRIMNQDLWKVVAAEMDMVNLRYL
jgi:hypothetical protein